MSGWGIVGVVITVGGVAWCYWWPAERDRFAHTVYGWLVLVGVLVVTAVAKLFDRY